MVIRKIFLFTLLPSFLCAGQFTASVNRNEINSNEMLTLNLTLKDASAKGTPTVNALKHAFTVSTQQQLSNTFINNGKISVSTVWKFTLIPTSEGELTIPSIPLNTNEGVLYTEPLTVKVLKKSSANNNVDSIDANGLALKTELSKHNPYKNEPIVITVRLSSTQDLANLTVQKIQIDDAVLEQNGEAKITKKFVDGRYVGEIEFSYLLTPMKAGPLKIPSMVIHGGVASKRKTHLQSFFDEDFDPFAMLSGFERLKPFVLATKEMILDVQPALANINPWLPAKSLTIEEQWDDAQAFQVGEPITRAFKIVAEGIRANQLPSLNDLQAAEKSIKVYADKPVLSDNVSEGAIKSSRTEQYTLIPQQAGEIVLPEIKLNWWNVDKKATEQALVPARRLTIAAANNATKINSDTATASELAPNGMQTGSLETNYLLYIIAAALAGLLCAAIVWGMALQNKIKRLSQNDAPQKDKGHKNSKYDQKHGAEDNAKYSPQNAKAKHSAVNAAPTMPKEKKDKHEKLPDLNPT